MSTAIVVGGGIAGLSTTAMALKHFNRVILIERDDLTGSRVLEESYEQTRARRSGCPQYTAPHFLFAGGLTALEALVPGVTAELKRRGAHVGDPARVSFAYHRGRQWPRHMESGITVAGCSRRLLDETVLKLLCAAAGNRLTLRDRTKVASLVWGGKNGRAVTGVRLTSGESLAADVVFWTGGAGTQNLIIEWIQAAGVQVPTPRYVHWPVDYVYRHMKLPADYDSQAEFVAAAINGRPGPDRSGSVRVAEDGMAEFMLAEFGHEGPRVPTDHDGWMAFAATLARPQVAELAARCEPAGPIVRHAFPAGLRTNCFQRLDKVKTPPGLVVLGDALHTTNPCFGQGMPMAIKGAAALDAALRKTLWWRRAASHGAAAAAAAPALQTMLYKELEVFWTVPAGEDLRGTGAAVHGVFEPPKVVYQFTDIVMDAAMTDPKVFSRVVHIMHMLEPVTKLALVAHRVLHNAPPGTLTSLMRVKGWGAAPALLEQKFPDPDDEEGSRRGERQEGGAGKFEGGDDGSEAFEDAAEDLDLDLMMLKDAAEEEAPDTTVGVKTAAA